MIPVLARTDVTHSDELSNKLLRSQCRQKECSVLIGAVVLMFTLNNNAVYLIHKDATKKTNVGTFTTHAAHLCVCVCVCLQR